MRDGVKHSGPTDPDGLAAADRLVLHVDPDVDVRATTAAALTATEGAVDVLSVPSADRAATVLADLRADCVVVGNVASTGFLADVDAPVTLYTALAPVDVDDDLLAAADTFVERRGAGQPDFLARKVLSLADGSEGRTDYALARALSRAGVADERETHQFLVDDAGAVAWASAPFEDVFPVDRLATRPPETDDFDAQLRALLADAPSALSTVFRTKRGATRCERESFSVPTAAGESHFVHAGYRLPDELDSLRLEVFEHVTPEVQREARIELLEVLVEESRDGLYTLDAQGNIDFCNPSFAGMLGYDPDELIGRHATSVLVDGELEQGQARVADLLDDPDRDSTTVDMTFRTRSGERLELAIHFTLLPAEDGSYAGLMGVARDISARKQRERELQEYRKLVEAARDPMFVLDADGDITLFNEPMVSVVDADRLAGRSLTALFSPPEREQLGALLDSLRTGESEWEQYEIRVSEGMTDRLYEATVGALRDEDGFAGTVGTLRDVTERNRRTHELDLLKQVLARVLRHNIRSQLTVVQSYAEQLLDESVEPTAAGEAVLDVVESLLATAEKAREIERLVDSDIDRQRLDVAAVVDRAVERVESDYPAATYEVDVPSVDVVAHPALETAVENAVENAVVHTEAARVRLTASVSCDRVELRVADDGAGIPDTDLAALEQREETPLQHTSGAGLWLIDWVVSRSGGTLSFDSGDDGTTLTLALDRTGVDRSS